MRKEILYIFMHNDNIYKYIQFVYLNDGISRYDTYMYLEKLSMYVINLFIRDHNIPDDFKMDFTICIDKNPYYMYVERINDEYNNYSFTLKPLIHLMENNQFSYNDMTIANTYRCNNFIVPADIVEFKIIDDGINDFDDSHVNILDNLPFTVEKIYLLYNVKTPITNLPFSTKKVYVYKNCDSELIRLPFDCELVIIN